MIKYLIGLLKYLFFPLISKIALIDYRSELTKKVKICSKSKVFNSKINDYTYVGYNTFIVYSYLGKYCSISEDCRIGLANHTSTFLSTSPIFTEKKNATGFSWIKKTYANNIYKQVKIGNDVWIGAKVTVLGGVEIGDGAIIGTGAIVTKNVPPYAIVAGIPAKILKYRFSEEIIDELMKIEWWNFSESIIRSNISVFQSENIDIKKLRSLKTE